MEKKKKDDTNLGSCCKTPDVKSSENVSNKNTPISTTLAKRGKIGTPNSSRVLTRASPRRKSASSTPESLTQRELKRLEDYWTRNEPIKEDSPRLRSNRKVNFTLKECLGERSRTKNSHDTEKVKCQIVEQASLPESPIPERCVTFNEANSSSLYALSTLSEKSNSNITSQIKRKEIPDICQSSQPSFTTQRQLCSSPTSRATQLCSSPTSQATQLFSSPTSQAKQLCSSPTSQAKQLSKQKSQEPKQKHLSRGRTRNSCDTVANLPCETAQRSVEDDTSSDSDDDDYIPPRKKLRSEVTKDELWDGIPLTISFKRLAPISKTPTDKPSVFSHLKQKQPTETEETKETKEEIFKEDKANVTKTSHKKSAEKVITKSIRELKRSARLREKLTGTPVKNEGTNEGSTTTVGQVPKMVENCSRLVKKDSSVGLIETDCASTSKKSRSNSIEIDENPYSVEEKCTQEINKDSFSGDSGDILLKLTLSQILSVDNKNDINSLESTNDDKDDEETRHCSPVKENTETTSASVSISKTINDIFSDIDGHSELSKSSEEINAPSTSSKHNPFTKNTNKGTKIVPPLKIKLKQSFKGVSNISLSAKQKNKTTKTKSKVKKRSESTADDLEQEKDFSSSAEKEVDQTATRKPCVADKKGFTPKSKKKNITKQRKCRSPRLSPSPPPSNTIALRLNNERRLSAAGTLLSNPVLNKHACVLWSSENRRHMQLSNPKATLSELDAKLSLKWDRLSDKEKLKYFQRARDAIKDENRHSNRRHNTVSVVNVQKDMETKFSEDSSVDNFVKLTSASQMTEIKKWLNFYNEVSSEACAEVIRSFKETLVEENRHKTKDTELDKSRTKSKKSKQKRKEEQRDSTNSHSNYRKILFEKILDKKESIIGILNDKKKAVQDTYSSMLKRMVVGEEVSFAGDVKSDKLTETLTDVKALEKDSKLAVTGEKCAGKEYGDILARLSERSSPDGKGFMRALSDTAVDEDHVDNICKQIKSFPLLSPKTLEVYLPEVLISDSDPSDGLVSPLLIGRGNRNSPVKVLTEWVAEDLIARQPQIGFRKAISLLSNKVVPSPTIILPSNAGNGSRSTANVNQNCNIVFTKLQKSLPSGLAELRLNFSKNKTTKPSR